MIFSAGVWRRTVPLAVLAAAVATTPLTEATAATRPTVAPAVTGSTSAAPGGLHVVGSGIVDGSGRQVQPHGVNFSGFEYSCLDGVMNDGPVPPNLAEVTGMKSWNVNSVRIPLNEDCWLGLHGIDKSVSGAAYQSAVAAFVDLLTGNGLSVVLNLHFTGDGTRKAVEQEPMADRAHAVAFWTSVAERFKGNSAVMFEPFNEPHLNDVDVSGGTAWGCWRDGGCTVKGTNSGDGSFVVAGMQEMIDAIRATGATNIVIATGEDWGADLSGWVQYRPNDPTGQLAAGWHTYHDGLSCNDPACWNTVLVGVLAVSPIVTTEIGQLTGGCNTTYVEPVLDWLDSHNRQGYYAWAWGPFSCTKDPALLTDWTGTPTQTYGSGYRAHLLSRP